MQKFSVFLNSNEGTWFLLIGTVALALLVILILNVLARIKESNHKKAEILFKEAKEKELLRQNKIDAAQDLLPRFVLAYVDMEDDSVLAQANTLKQNDPLKSPVTLDEQVRFLPDAKLFLELRRPGSKLSVDSVLPLMYINERKRKLLETAPIARLVDDYEINDNDLASIIQEDEPGDEPNKELLEAAVPTPRKRVPKPKKNSPKKKTTSRKR